MSGPEFLVGCVVDSAPSALGTPLIALQTLLYHYVPKTLQVIPI
jgi:hypothetical protein